MYRFSWPRAGVAVAAALLAGVMAPSSALAAKSVYYAGSTSPANTPMTLTLGKAKLTRLALLYDTSCFSYGSVLNAAALRGVKIDKRGKITGKAKTNLIDNPRIYWSGERSPDTLVEQFTGTIKGNTARGTARATVTFLDGSTCTSGTQQWAVTHKPGRVFGGVSNQSMPVAVELSSSGAQIKHLHVGLIASCTGGGSMVVGDFLTNFNIVGGTVNESFSQQYPRSAGGVTTIPAALERVREDEDHWLARGQRQRNRRHRRRGVHLHRSKREMVGGKLNLARHTRSRVIRSLASVAAAGSLLLAAAPAAVGYCEPGTHESVAASADGYQVHVCLSEAYASDPSRVQSLGGALGSLLHGPEMALLTITLKTPADVAKTCGSADALACYAGDRMVLPGELRAGSPPLTYLLAHEYGHHVLAHTRNDPWPAQEWGSKRWASVLGVCHGRTAAPAVPRVRLDAGGGIRRKLRHAAVPDAAYALGLRRHARSRRRHGGRVAIRRPAPLDRPDDAPLRREAPQRPHADPTTRIPARRHRDVQGDRKCEARARAARRRQGRGSRASGPFRHEAVLHDLR